jgi:DMSO/TMAO reductase YedYZ heme-binding membrane subunit
MSVKADISGPLTYAVIFAVLFAYRIWDWRATSLRPETPARVQRSAP